MYCGNVVDLLLYIVDECRWKGKVGGRYNFVSGKVIVYHT